MTRSAPRHHPRLVSRSTNQGEASQRAQLEELFAELSAVYADADAAFSGWSCPASTECCRFGITGREPYVTSIELALLERAIGARGGANAVGRRRPLPMAPIARDERACPLLTAEGRCAVYAARPLGCRTFFCDRASSGGVVKHKEVTALVRRIQVIAARHETDGDRGRPLTRALAERR